MPRLARSGRNLGTSPGTATARKPGRAGTPSEVASVTALNLAPGIRGWRMPRLDGVAATHKVWRGDRVAAAISGGLLKADLADASTWTCAKRDPFEFIQLSLAKFVDRHGGQPIQDCFPLGLTLTGTLNEYSTADREIDAAKLFLTIDPREAGYLVLGSTIEVLGRQHPRLPATFFHLLTSALNRWIRVYDYRDAKEHVERLRDWYSADPDCGEAEVPDVDASIPASVLKKPLSATGLRSILRDCSGDVRTWMEQALEIRRLSCRSARPQLTEEMEEALTDCNAPLPCLLIVCSPRDNIEACFDVEAESMMEVPPEPNLIIPINVLDETTVRGAFATLANVCETLAAASKLISLLPDSKFNQEA